MKRFLTTGCILVAMAGLAMGEEEQAAQAPATPAPTPQASVGNFTWKGIKLFGWGDFYGLNNLNNPELGVNQQRSFDFKADKWDLNMVKFAIDKSAEPVGFRFDVGFGRAFEVFQLTEPTRRVDQLEPIMQGYVSFKPKAWKGMQVDFGKFFTSAGAELTETNLGWNYSRSLIYNNGPFFHFGLRTTMPIHPNFTFGVQVVNGWNNVADNNSGKTLGFTGVYTKGKISYANSYYTGPEKFKNNKGWRNFWDQVLTINVNDKFSTYLNFDIAGDRQLDGTTSKWHTLGWAYRYQFSKKWAFANRYEYYNDMAGFITGTAQTIKEATFTLEHKFFDGFLTRFEYRNDWSNKQFFSREAGKPLGKSMSTFLIGFVGYFGPK